MKRNSSESDKDNPETNKDDPETEPTAHHFTAKVDKDTQAAVLRNLYIPRSLRDKLKKPKIDKDEGLGR